MTRNVDIFRSLDVSSLMLMNALGSSSSSNSLLPLIISGALGGGSTGMGDTDSLTTLLLLTSMTDNSTSSSSNDLLTLMLVGGGGLGGSSGNGGGLWVGLVVNSELYYYGCLYTDHRRTLSSPCFSSTLWTATIRLECPRYCLSSICCPVLGRTSLQTCHSCSC